jgi:hypothetical protein
MVDVIAPPSLPPSLPLPPTHTTPCFVCGQICVLGRALGYFQWPWFGVFLPLFVMDSVCAICLRWSVMVPQRPSLHATDTLAIMEGWSLVRRSALRAVSPPHLCPRFSSTSARGRPAHNDCDAAVLHPSVRPSLRPVTSRSSPLSLLCTLRMRWNGDACLASHLSYVSL